MYQDTEQAYGNGWTLDVYQSRIDGLWVVDFWNRRDPSKTEDSVRGHKKKVIVDMVKRKID